MTCPETSPGDRPSGGRPSRADQHDIGSRWTLTLVEPLLPTGSRVRLDRQLAAITATDPDWSVMFFAGVASDMMLTLPTSDPWRHLSARAGTRMVGCRPPGSFGVVSAAGGTFGTWQNADDVVDPLAETDPRSDVAFAALAYQDLPSAGGVLLAFAARAFDDAVAAGRSIVDEVGAAGLFDAGTAAVRWAVHRRRSYGLSDDPWPVESGWAWSWRAGRICDGKRWADDQAAGWWSQRIVDEQVDG